MTRWQYAWMTDQPMTTIGFSHPQPGLAGELAAVLGPGVYIQQSTEWSVSLDRSRVNLGYVSGLLGDRGWEMFAVETRLQPGAVAPSQVQTNWYFKREAPAGGASSVAATASTAQSAPMTQPGAMGQSMAAAAPMAAASMTDAAPAAPMVDAAPAAPMVDAALAAPAAPAGPVAPDPAVAAVPAPPPGPVATPMPMSSPVETTTYGAPPTTPEGQ